MSHPLGLEFYKEGVPLRIAITRYIARGDVIMAVAVGHGLRKKYPNAIIDFFTVYPEFIKGNPNFNNVYSTVPASNNYDIIYNLRTEIDRKIPAILLYCKICGIDEFQYRLPITGELDAFGTSIVGEKKECIALIINTPDGGRRWEYPKWQEIVNRLQKAGQKVILLGRPNKPILQNVLHKNLSCLQDAAVIRNCKLYLGIDTLGLNMALAVGTRVFCVFGTSSSHFEPKWRVTWIGDDGIGIEDPSQKINNITVNQVWDKLKEVLQIG